MISTFDYKRLLQQQNKVVAIKQDIKTFIPEPTYKDYRRGYIKRYFIQRFNDDNATIYEVNDSEYEKYLSDNFYNAISLEWRISGTEEQINDSNFKSVKLATKKMKSIILHLPNYLQFSNF